MKVTKEQAIKLIRANNALLWDYEIHETMALGEIIVTDNFRLRIETSSLFSTADLLWCNEVIASGRYIYEEFERILSEQRRISQMQRDLELQKRFKELDEKLKPVGGSGQANRNWNSEHKAMSAGMMYDPSQED